MCKEDMDALLALVIALDTPGKLWLSLIIPCASIPKDEVCDDVFRGDSEQPGAPTAEPATCNNSFRGDKEQLDTGVGASWPLLRSGNSCWP